MRIRPADRTDLRRLAEIQAIGLTFLVERYEPDGVAMLPIDPESQVPMFGHLLGTGAVLVAEDPDPVGVAAAIVRDGVWHLSQLWVLPERQGEGIGSRLLDEALAWGRGVRAFTVVGSPHPPAQTLYLRRSMFPVWNQLDLAGEVAASAGEEERDVAELLEDDQTGVNDLDREVRGTARPEDHAFWRAFRSGLALRRDGRLGGYVYVDPSGRIGPGAVRDSRDMTTLVAAACRRVEGPVSFSVPFTNWAALGHLVARGLRPTGSSTFMASRPWPDGSRYLSSGGALA